MTRDDAGTALAAAFVCGMIAGVVLTLSLIG